MKVYEMIQELVRYDADAEVVVNVEVDKRSTDVYVPDTAELDADNELEVEIDEEADYEVESKTRYAGGKRTEYVQISAYLG